MSEASSTLTLHLCVPSAEAFRRATTEHETTLEIACERQAEFRRKRTLKICWSCLDGHEHETKQQAAECIGDHLMSAARATVEAERAGR